MSNPFEDDFSIGTVFGDDETVYDLAKILNKSPAQIAIEFGNWFKDTFGGGGPKGPQEWITFGDQWLKEGGGATSGTTATGQGSGLGQYAKDRNATTTAPTDTTTTPTDTTTTATMDAINSVTPNDQKVLLENLGVDATGMSPQEIAQALAGVLDSMVLEDVSDLAGEFSRDEFDVLAKVFMDAKYPVSSTTDPFDGLGDSDLTDDVVDDVVDDIPGGPADNSTIEEIIATGKQPEGFDWSSILAGLGGLGGLGSLIGGLTAPKASGGLLDKLFDIYTDYTALKDYDRYKVPTSQMDAQSTVGKDWGLPSKESMVMQGLGPNYLQGQKYAMNLGQTMPAATHVGGMPYIEKGEHGGVMGLKKRYGDITPAFLEPGEFVFTKKATDNIGAKRLYKLMKQAEEMGMR